MKKNVEAIQFGSNKFGMLMRIAERHSDVIVQQQASNQLTRVTQYCIVSFVFEKQLHQILAQTILHKKLPIGFA